MGSLQQTKRANYGLDMPGGIFLFLGVALIGTIAVCFGVIYYGWNSIYGKLLIVTGVINTLLFLITALFMIYSSVSGKLIEIERVIDYDLKLSGEEQVLDACCGKGIFLIEIAKRLTIGMCTGIDDWSGNKKTKNNKEKTWDNVLREQVEDRVKLFDGDLRELPFEAESFDVVVSNLINHHTKSPMDRMKMIQELTRVCRPGGKILIIDFVHTESYVQMWRELGLEEIQSKGLRFRIFPPANIVSAVKPQMVSEVEEYIAY